MLPNSLLSPNSVWTAREISIGQTQLTVYERPGGGQFSFGPVIRGKPDQFLAHLSSYSETSNKDILPKKRAKPLCPAKPKKSIKTKITKKDRDLQKSTVDIDSLQFQLAPPPVKKFSTLTEEARQRILSSPFFTGAVNAYGKETGEVFTVTATTNDGETTAEVRHNNKFAGSRKDTIWTKAKLRVLLDALLDFDKPFAVECFKKMKDLPRYITAQEIEALSLSN